MRGSQYGTLEWQETKTGLGIQEAGLRMRWTTADFENQWTTLGPHACTVCLGLRSIPQDDPLQDRRTPRLAKALL